MRRLSSYLLIICVFACVLLCACGEESSVDGAMTPIKDDSGNIVGYERKYHNDNGDITRWDVYDAQEQYDHYVLYEYNSNGYLGKETYYQASGIGVYYYAYSYTDAGVLAEKDYVSAKEGSTRTLYDSDGNENIRYTYDLDDVLVKYEEFVNDQWEERDLPTESDKSAEDAAE